MDQAISHFNFFLLLIPVTNFHRRCLCDYPLTVSPTRGRSETTRGHSLEVVVARESIAVRTSHGDDGLGEVLAGEAGGSQVCACIRLQSGEHEGG